MSSDATPIVFKRTKSKPSARTTRERSPTSTADANDGPATAGAGDAPSEESPTTLATKLKAKAAKRAKPQSRLSFGTNDDGDDDEAGDGKVFQLKKSNLSQKLKLGTHPALSTSSSSTASVSSGPVYDAAYLSELKASTPSSRRPQVAESTYDIDISMDPLDPTADISTVDEAQETTIAPESVITNAKQKRERLRTQGAAQDYISLSLITRSDADQGPHPESRLVREEDELGEAEEEFAEYTSAQERIALGKKSRKVEAAKRRDAMKEMIEEATEEDEETMEWEQEQLRRGGHAPDEQATSVKVKEVYKPAPIPPTSAVPTLAPANARLSQALSALTLSHAKNTSAMTSLAEERAQLETREAELRQMVENAEAKRSWFAAFREWIESVATFLDEKAPRLEKLEDEHISILKERADMLESRRVADDEDDLAIFLGSLPTSQTQNEPEETDELGRVVPRANPEVLRRERRSARTARRQRRQQARAPSSRANGEEEEGYSTDSSLPPSDAADYQAAIDKISRDGRDILSDVRAEEFRNPMLGLGKWFGQWRSRFDDTYTGAWGGLGMVGAWEFWVRLEIVAWDPIKKPQSLDSFSWYASLYQYSRPKLDEEGDEAELGPDGDLVSAMISTAVIPRLYKIIEGGAFNPYSAKDLRRMLDLVEEVEAHVDKSQAKFQQLLKVVTSPFKNAVAKQETTIAPFLAHNKAKFDPDAIPARKRLLARQVKLLQNLLRWRKYVGELYGLGELCNKLVGDVIVPIAQTGWEVGGEDAVRKVQNIAPREVLPPWLDRL